MMKWRREGEVRDQVAGVRGVQYRGDRTDLKKISSDTSGIPVARYAIGTNILQYEGK